MTITTKTLTESDLQDLSVQAWLGSEATVIDLASPNAAPILLKYNNKVLALIDIDVGSEEEIDVNMFLSQKQRMLAELLPEQKVERVEDVNFVGFVLAETSAPWEDKSIVSSMLRDMCIKAVGKYVHYKGTNGDEYDKANHGKPVEGEGLCLEYHDSHGLCIIVQHDDGTKVCVDVEPAGFLCVQVLERIVAHTDRSMTAEEMAKEFMEITSPAPPSVPLEHPIDETDVF
jgi:hypothetical protein